MPKVRAVRFPCAVCSFSCGTETIQCKSCHAWSHRQCTQLSADDFREFGQTHEFFQCYRCFGQRADGTFDLSVSLTRLRADPTPVTVDNVLRLLSLYVPVSPQRVNVQSPPGREDNVSTAILRTYHGAMLQRLTPRATVGDGNCAFRAVSLALYATEAHHDYVRLLTACEMITHREMIIHRTRTSS
jgi:hypothetical protein